MIRTSTIPEVLKSRRVQGALAVLAMVFGGASLGFAIIQRPQISASLAGLTTATATILLVSITAKYVSQTEALVEETKRQREEEQERRDEREEKRTERLRQAFLAELEGLFYLEEWTAIREGSPPRITVSTRTVYDSNASDIGRLTDREIQFIVEFYTRSEYVEEAIEFHNTKKIEHDTSPLSFDNNESAREDGIRALVDRLELSRRRAIIQLKYELGELDLDPQKDLTAGTVNLPPKVQKDVELELKYGLLERKGGAEYSITNVGEKFYRGEINTTDLEGSGEQGNVVTRMIDRIWSSTEE